MKDPNVEVVRNYRGDFAVKVLGFRGKFADYHAIATLQVDLGGRTRTFIAVSEYGIGQPALEPGKVYEVSGPVTVV